MAINLVTKYAKQIDEKFAKESFVGNDYSSKFSFDGAETIKVYTPKVVSMNNYDRPTTDTKGSAPMQRFGSYTEVGDEINTYSVTQDRAFALTLDSANVEERDKIITAMSTLGTQIKEVATPEMDRYTFHKWNVESGQKILNTDTKFFATGKNILDRMIMAMGKLDNALVPSGNRTIYIPVSNVYDVLTDSRFIALEKLGTQAIEKGYIGQVAGMKVKAVPDALFKIANVTNDVTKASTKTALADATVSGGAITKNGFITPEFMVVYKDSVIRPVKAKTTRILNDVVGVDGDVIEARFRYDAFVLDAKKDGVLVCQAK